MHHFVHNTEKHLLDLLLADIKIKMSRHPFKQWCESDFLTALLPPPPSFHSLSSLACRPPARPASPHSSPQLNLIHSEVSNLAGFDVEGVINPTNAELELKDDLGEPPSQSPRIAVGRLKILECSAAQGLLKLKCQWSFSPAVRDCFITIRLT